MVIEMFNYRKYAVSTNFCENLRILGIQWGVNLLIY